mmetsp:Transcript_75831/g.203125  ORF Transcript_75831/g.203125 Transcript_75831/m.203125 type:complete len:360 (-) Transcript_75831:1206-2285(-)
MASKRSPSSRMRASLPFTSTSCACFFLCASAACSRSTVHRSRSSLSCSSKSRLRCSRSCSRRARSRWSSFCTCCCSRSSASRLSCSSSSFFCLSRSFLSMFMSAVSSTSAGSAAAAAAAAFFDLGFDWIASSSFFLVSSSRCVSSSLRFASSRRSFSSSARRASCSRRSISSFWRLCSSCTAFICASRSISSLRSSICWRRMSIMRRSSSRLSASCLNATAFCCRACSLSFTCTRSSAPCRPRLRLVSWRRIASDSSPWSTKLIVLFLWSSRTAACPRYTASTMTFSASCSVMKLASCANSSSRIELYTCPTCSTSLSSSTRLSGTRYLTSSAFFSMKARMGCTLAAMESGSKSPSSMP